MNVLTGTVPFDGESSQEIILKHLTADPDLSRVQQPLPTSFRNHLPDPTARFRDCREMLNALGWELDASGLAIKKVGDLDAPPVLQPMRNAGRPAGEIPIARPIGSFEATTMGQVPPHRTPQCRTRHFEPMALSLWATQCSTRGCAVSRTCGSVRTSVHRRCPKLYSKLATRRTRLGHRSIDHLLGNQLGLDCPLCSCWFSGCYLCYYVVWYLSGGAIALPTKSNPAQKQYVKNVQPVRSPQAYDRTEHYQNAPPQPAPKAEPKPNPYSLQGCSAQLANRATQSVAKAWISGLKAMNTLAPGHSQELLRQ